ncbi:hypothetical protein COOONC_26280 [Cooperia oncophora]
MEWDDEGMLLWGRKYELGLCHFWRTHPDSRHPPDQTDAVAAHTHRGIEFLERLGAFAKERAMIEEEYAAKLRYVYNDVSTESLGRKKEDEEAAKSFTYVRSFANLLHELELLAGQHEVCTV